MMHLRTIVLTIIALLFARVVIAHESQPGFLELRQLTTDQYEISWRAPLYFGSPHPANLQLPTEWEIIGNPAQRRTNDSIVHTKLISTSGKSVEGAVISFPGLETTITDIFVRLVRMDGTVMTAIARPTKPQVALRGDRAWHATASEYLFLGFHHILLGIDHLLFVLGLLLIVKGRLMLLKTITSFTIAHSITLGLATLGYAQAPLLPLNTAIALSILFLGPEIMRARRGQSSVTIRYPWVVAFIFGLLHGFGFASGLSVSGMPKAELPWALLWFNLGVEGGQILFVVLALGLARSFRVLQIIWPRWALLLPGYTVGSLGAYWTIQRSVLLFGGL